MPAALGRTLLQTYGVDVVEQLSGGRSEHSIHHIAHQILQPVQQIVKADEGTLRLDVGVPKAEDGPSGGQTCSAGQPSAGRTGTHSDKCRRVRDCSAL